MSLSLAEENLAQQLDFEHDILSMLKKYTQAQLQKITLEKAIVEDDGEDFYLNRQTFLGQIVPKQKILEYEGDVTKLIVEGVSVTVSLSEIRQLAIDIQLQLEPKGYLAFATDYNHIENQGKIIVIKGQNRYDILTIQLTNGANYDISNRDIVDRLQQWENISSFQILGVGFDWVELQFQTLPINLNAFAEEIYQFCPDILDQGYVGEALNEDANFEDWEEALDSQTSEDLARSLQKTKNIFLWWD